MIGKKLNPSRRKVLAAGCKVKVVYKKSKRPKGIVLKQSRKAGKKLAYHAVVKLTVAVKHQPKVAKQEVTEGHDELASRLGAGSPVRCRKTARRHP